MLNFVRLSINSKQTIMRMKKIASKIWWKYLKMKIKSIGSYAKVWKAKKVNLELPIALSPIFSTSTIPNSSKSKSIYQALKGLRFFWKKLKHTRPSSTRKYKSSTRKSSPRCYKRKGKSKTSKRTLWLWDCGTVSNLPVESRSIEVLRWRW